VNLADAILLAIFKALDVRDVEVIEYKGRIFIYSLTDKIFGIFVPDLDAPCVGFIVPLECWIDRGQYKAKISAGNIDLMIVEDWNLFETLLDIFARLVDIDVEKLRRLIQTAVEIYCVTILAVWLVMIDRESREELRKEANNVLRYISSIPNMLKKKKTLKRKTALERGIRLLRSLLDKSCRLLKDLSAYNTEIVIEVPSRIPTMSSVWLKHVKNDNEDVSIDIDLLCLSKDRYIINLGIHTDSPIDILAMLPLSSTYVEDVVNIEMERMTTVLDMQDFPDIAKKHVDTCTRLVKTFGYRPFKAFNILKTVLPHVEKNFKGIEISCEYVIDGTLSTAVPSRFIVMYSSSLSDVLEPFDCLESFRTQICREVLETLSIKYCLVDKFSLYEALHDPAYRDYILVSEVGVIVPQSGTERITIFPLLADEHVEIDEDKGTIRTKEEFIKTSIEVGRRIEKMLEKEKITDVKLSVLSLEGSIFNPSCRFVWA